MKLPEIGYDVGKIRSEIVSMGGINYSDRYKDGDLRHSVNLSARRWPYITTRRAREQQSGYSGVTALTAWGKLVAVRGTDLLYDGNVVGHVTPGEKQFAVVNTKMVIWPDKVYLDLPTMTLKPLAASTVLSDGSVNFTQNGFTTDYRAIIPAEDGGYEEDPNRWHENFTSDKAKDYPSFRFFTSVSRTAAGWVENGLNVATPGGSHQGSLFELDQYSFPNYSLGNEGFKQPHPRRYGELLSVTVSVYSVLVEYRVYDCPIQNGNLAEIFQAGDAIKISGAGANDRNDIVIKTISPTSMTFDGAGFSPGAGFGNISLSRKSPDLDFICESENRLWGCSNKDQTIYASALGDPTNFYVFDGLSTDSYAVAVGTEGDFTGCCKLGSSVLFWKETKLHKVLGSFPAEYSVYTYETEGLKAGCHKSLQVINDVLFYMGIHGVYLYTGGTPSLISDCFGELELSEAVGGTDGDTYYLSAKEENGPKRHLLLYETKFSIWVREDDTKAVDFARIGRKLYFVDGSGKVWLADNGQDDPNMEWLCQFAPFYETISGRKSYSKILLRMELPKGSWVISDVRHDGGPWRECGKIIGRENDVIPLRLALNRCDKFEIRLRGKGPCAILSMLREYSVGSDV